MSFSLTDVDLAFVMASFMYYANINLKSGAAFCRFVLAVLIASTICAAETARTRPTPFHIQAHRGAGIEYSENTLEAFEHGWNLGVTPECDVRTTKDGVIVCFHDTDFKR